MFQKFLLSLFSIGYVLSLSITDPITAQPFKRPKSSCFCLLQTNDPNPAYQRKLDMIQTLQDGVRTHSWLPRPKLGKGPFKIFDENFDCHFFEPKKRYTGQLSCGYKYTLYPSVNQGGCGSIRKLKIEAVEQNGSFDGVAEIYALKTFKHPPYGEEDFARQIDGDPHFLRRFATFIDRNGNYVEVLEFIGPNLQQEFNRNCRSRKSILQVQEVKDVIDALVVLHQKGLVFWDFKWENAALTTDRTSLVLIDLDSIGPATGKYAAKCPHTPGYIAPERIATLFPDRVQLNNDGVDWQKADVFALGVAILQTITTLPIDKIITALSEKRRDLFDFYQEFFTAEKLNSHPSFSKVREFPEWGLVIRMLDPNPETRPSMQEVQKAWNALNNQ